MIAFGLLIGMMVALTTTSGITQSTMGLLFGFVGGSILSWIRPTQTTLQKLKTDVMKNTDAIANIAKDLNPADKSIELIAKGADLKSDVATFINESEKDVRSEMVKHITNFSIGALAGIALGLFIRLMDPKISEWVTKPETPDVTIQNATKLSDAEHKAFINHIILECQTVDAILKDPKSNNEDVKRKILEKLAAHTQASAIMQKSSPDEKTGRLHLYSGEKNVLYDLREKLQPDHPTAKDDDTNLRLKILAITEDIKNTGRFSEEQREQLRIMSPLVRSGAVKSSVNLFIDALDKIK